MKSLLTIGSEVLFSDGYYYVTQGNDCNQCDFKGKPVQCDLKKCSRVHRDDKTDVIFKKTC